MAPSPRRRRLASPRPGTASRCWFPHRTLPANEGAVSGGERPWDVRVYALNHTARDLLGALKVWDALDASRVAPVDAMAVNGDGKNGGSLGFDAFGAHTGALAWIVEDSNLNGALDAALKFAHKVEIVKGCGARLHLRPGRARRCSWKTAAASTPAS